MITKAKKLSYTTSDNESYETIEQAKAHELQLLTSQSANDWSVLVSKSKEAIAILRLGLPRKPRTVKPKSVKSKKPAAATQPA